MLSKGFKTFQFSSWCEVCKRAVNYWVFFNLNLNNRSLGLTHMKDSMAIVPSRSISNSPQLQGNYYRSFQNFESAFDQNPRFSEFLSISYLVIALVFVLFFVLYQITLCYYFLYYFDCFMKKMLRPPPLLFLYCTFRVHFQINSSCFLFRLRRFIRQ